MSAYGDGYEIITGHRRKVACTWAGIEEVPVILRELDDADAVIAIIENQMYQNDLSIENAQGENLSAEVYKRIIDEMLDHIDDMPDSDKKLMMNLLIEKVEIYEEKQKDGRWVKSVQFKIPLNVDGKLVDTMFFDDDDTENSLPNEKHVETVCLMSKREK